MAGDLGQNVSRPERWMVVRRDAKLPGGWRVIAANHNEETAQKIAAAYDDDYKAMPTSRLYELRIEAMRDA